MKSFVWIVLLTCSIGQVSAQVKHEVKIPFFNMFLLDYAPSYEIISKKERVGLEIGAGFDFSKAQLTTSNDSFPSFTDPSLKYKRRIFKSSVALKFYGSAEIRNVLIGFFVGPFANYNETTFYEDAYFVRHEELLNLNPNRSTRFIGQREIVTGINAGFKFVFKSNLVIEPRYSIAVQFDEREPNSLTYRRAFLTGGPTIKVGYRFGKKPTTKTIEELGGL